LDPNSALSLFDQAVNWLILNAAKLVPILILTVIVVYIANRFVGEGVKRLREHLIARAVKKSELPIEAEKRLGTLFMIIEKIIHVVIWGIGILVILATLGVPIAPVLAGAGVLGLAISFGAQSLVKDVIQGVFMIFENQIRVGDVATINGQGGLVEAINLRTVILRDLTGTVHVFPNGSITTLANLTKDWSAAVMNIGVAYKEDPDHVIEVLKAEGKKLREDEVCGPKIIQDLEVFGVEDFGDSAVVIRIRFKTLPIEQWNVAREFRKRIKKAFDAEGIEIPFPHRTMYFGEASPPFNLAMRRAAATDPPKETS